MVVLGYGMGVLIDLVQKTVKRNEKAEARVI